MKYTIQYIPLKMIKPGMYTKMNDHIRNLRNVMLDCMHLMVVRKNKKDNTYTIVSGQSRYDFYRNHTKKQYAPCIIDQDNHSNGIFSIILSLFNLQPQHPNSTIREKLTPTSVSIIRDFLKYEPRFNNLTSIQKIKIVMLAIGYKKTVVESMKEKVDRFLFKNH